MPKARVLAVDDQRYFRELIEGLLSEEGYEVQTASSGEEALHILEREHFDIVVTDLVMPDIDGSELCDRIKRRLPNQDIVMVTGVVDVKTAVDAMKQGATDYILKPFDRNTLSHSLETILQRRRLSNEHAQLMAENLEYMGVLSLYERAAGLFATLSLEPLAERIVEGLCLETRAQGGVVWSLEDLGESVLRLVGARGIIRLDEERETIEVTSLGEEFRPLLEEGHSVVVPWSGAPSGSPAGEPEADPEMDEEAVCEDEALYVPLRYSGSLIGLARLSDKLEGGEFADADRIAAEKFASFGSTALVNALRFRSLERRSFRDPTTKAYTHAYFHDVVRNEIQKANRFGHSFSLVRVDTGTLSELRGRSSESEVARWLEGLVHQLGGALRATDLLAAESDTRYCVLLPETDALGAAVFKQRIRSHVEQSRHFQSLPDEARLDLALAAATFPSDGTQLESLSRILDQRLLEERESLLRTLSLSGEPFPAVLECLLDQGAIERPEFSAQITRFLIDDLNRRPRDRGLLFYSPAAAMRPEVEHGLDALGAADTATDVVLLAESPHGHETNASQPIRWVSPERIGSDRSFLLYYGDGPAYAMVSASQPGEAGLHLFHTADRALIEHLAFQLQRDLGIPLGT